METFLNQHFPGRSERKQTQAQFFPIISDMLLMLLYMCINSQFLQIAVHLIISSLNSLQYNMFIYRGKHNN